VIPVFLVLGYFLCPIVVSKILLLPVYEFQKKSSVIYDEPEAQLAAKEDDTGRSKPSKKKKSPLVLLPEASLALLISAK